VIERTMNAYGAAPGDQGLDLETGAQVSIPEREFEDDKYGLVETDRTEDQAGPDSQRAWVRIVADATAVTFEGRPTTWAELGALLADVQDRKHTVLELAVTSDQITVAQQNEWFHRAAALAREHGFEYASFIGIHPAGSKGTSATPTESAGPGR
jgi:hypothetical protein